MSIYFCSLCGKQLIFDKDEESRHWCEWTFGSISISPQGDVTSYVSPVEEVVIKKNGK